MLIYSCKLRFLLASLALRASLRLLLRIARLRPFFPCLTCTRDTLRTGSGYQLRTISAASAATFSAAF